MDVMASSERSPNILVISNTYRRSGTMSVGVLSVILNCDRCLRTFLGFSGAVRTYLSLSVGLMKEEVSGRQQSKTDGMRTVLFSEIAEEK